MSLIGTLTSGVSALRSFTKGLEVIGNNIANVNTVGYKSASTSFSDSFSNTLRASTPSGSTAPNASSTQVGTGVKVASITSRFEQGELTGTGVPSDLAVSGNGFFVVRNPVDGSVYATRAGNFRIDDQGYLVTAQGFRVQGLTGGVPPSVVGSIRLRSSEEIASTWDVTHASSINAANVARDGAQAAAEALNNLVTSQASATSGADVLNAMNTALGNANAAVAAAQTATPFDANALAVATATRDALQTAYTAAQAANDEVDVTDPMAASFQLVAVKHSLTGSAVAANSTAASASDAAVAAATPAQRTSYSIDKLGNLVEFYADGSSAITNRVLLQAYNDPSALQKAGDNLFTGFAAAGAIGGLDLSAANNGAGGNGLGVIESGTLELSNVDLTDQFASMITTQRSFQASSRLITISDSVLEDIVNLKR